jgi:hypothetical protein
MVSSSRIGSAPHRLHDGIEDNEGMAHLTPSWGTDTQKSRRLRNNGAK